MPSKFKRVDTWKIKDKYREEDLVKLFATCHGYSFGQIMNIASNEGILIGTDKEKESLLQNLKQVYRMEGMWLVFNELVELNYEEIKKKKKDNHIIK